MDDNAKNGKNVKETDSKPAEKEKVAKKNFFVAKYAEFKAEFSKIIWPTREILLKHTVTVIFASFIVGVVIAVFDGAFALLFRGFASLVG